VLFVVVVDVEMTVDLVLGIHVDVHLQLAGWGVPSTRWFFRAVPELHVVVSGRVHVVTGNCIWVLGVMIHRHTAMVGWSDHPTSRSHQASRLHHHPAPSADVIYGIEDLDLRPPFLYIISRSLSSLELLTS
jgi:hypothetical protein